MTEDLATAHRVVVEAPRGVLGEEAARRLVESPHELAGRRQRALALPRVRPAAEHEISEWILGDREDVTLDELQHLAAVLVEAERTGRAREAGVAVHVLEPGLHDGDHGPRAAGQSRRRGPRRPTNGHL